MSWSDCVLCPFGKTANKVWYRGVPCWPDVLFIGEAPGKAEDHSGQPFVGQAGKLLDTQLVEWPAERLTYTIVNALLCRPCDRTGGSNRTPSPQEVANCNPRLQEQIASIAPVYAVVLLGKTAERAFDLFGAEYPLPAFRLWHPAYLLRKGSKSAEYKRWSAAFYRVKQFVLKAKERSGELSTPRS